MLNKMSADVHTVCHFWGVHSFFFLFNYLGNCKAHGTGHKNARQNLATPRPTSGTKLNAVSMFLPGVNQNLKLQTNVGRKNSQYKIL